MCAYALPQEDLVPLPVAASLAYCELIEVTSPLGSDENLDDVLELTALALVHVAPVYCRAADGTAALLSAPIGDRQARDFHRFYIRRNDLHTAIHKLRRLSPMVDFVPPEEARALARVEPVVFAEIMAEGRDDKALEVHVLRPSGDGLYEQERADTGPVAGETVHALVARIAALHGCRYASIGPAEDRWPPAWASSRRA